jgi:phage-related protein
VSNLHSLETLQVFLRSLQGINSQEDRNVLATLASTLHLFSCGHSQATFAIQEVPNGMKRRNYLAHYGFILLTCGGLVCVIAPTSAQSQTQTMGPQDRDDIATRRQLAGFDNFLDGHPELAEQIRKDPSLVNNQEFVERHGDLQQYLQQHPEVREEMSQNPNGFMRQEKRFDRREDQARDSDVTRRELANMDRFMDSHPEIAEQLRKNPALVNDEKFEKNHPALQQFLAEHPGVREEYKENPNAFMHQEQRFDRREDQARGDRDVTRGELANMDRFMDSHPEIAEQLRKNPALVNDEKFEKNHPALQQFLAEHPGVREEYKENPNAFMHQEQRFDRREDQARGARDVTRGELANMDRFMDSHPEIAEQLRRDPSLVNDKKFVDNHSELQQFLAEHPGMREEYKENPNAFMRQEQRFDRREDQARDRDVTRGELANMDRFMDSHPEIAEQLRKDPSLVNDKKFVNNHSDLQQFLAEHPGVREEYKENPNAFMHQEQRFDRREDFAMRHDRDVSDRERSSFGEFMQGHGGIAGDLSKNPSLANNQEYLENHPALRDYLKANPKVHQQLAENPQTFLQSTQQPATHATPKVGESKPK